MTTEMMHMLCNLRTEADDILSSVDCPWLKLLLFTCLVNLLVLIMLLKHRNFTPLVSNISGLLSSMAVILMLMMAADDEDEDKCLWPILPLSIFSPSVVVIMFFFLLRGFIILLGAWQMFCNWLLSSCPEAAPSFHGDSLLLTEMLSLSLLRKRKWYWSLGKAVNCKVFCYILQFISCQPAKHVQFRCLIYLNCTVCLCLLSSEAKKMGKAILKCRKALKIIIIMIIEKEMLHLHSSL